MNRNKKPFLITITLVILGLMITATASSVPQTENKQINRMIQWNSNAVSIQSERISLSKPYKMPTDSIGVLSGEPLYYGEFPGFDTNGQIIVLGFENFDEENVYFSYSSDGGTTWDEDAYGWQFDAMPEKPTIAYSSGNIFYGTMVPNWEVSGEVTLVEFIDGGDPDTWTAGTWDWEDYGIYGFEGASMASAPPDDPLKWGFITLQGYNGYSGNNADNCPYTMYSTGDGYATISWLVSGDTGDVLEGCTNPSNDLDPVKNLNYGIWQRYDSDEGYFNIEMRVDDYEYILGESPFDTAGEIVTAENNMNPDISAYDDNVIIVSETDVLGNNDIICYYSFDGMENFEKSYVAQSADDETLPRIVAVEENTAICSFIKDGTVYSSTTEDGGATWSDPEAVSEEENVQSADVCSLGNVYDADQTVYFSRGGTAAPILTIESIAGGIGVTSVIKNVGNADATDVQWSINLDGFVLIGKSASDTISTIAAGETKEIKSGFPLGFGNIDIAVSATCAEGASASESASGKLLLFFIIGL